MEERELLERRQRTHAVVEGALLGDIAIVFLLMRVYLPVPIVRTLLRTLASVPFVMLVQRRGLKITILASVAAYVLFSALVGPILALTAIDIAVAGILVGIGRRWHIPPGLNTILTGILYTVLDVVIPTIAALIIFQYPVKKLIDSARHFVRLLFQLLLFVMGDLHRYANMPGSYLRSARSWEPGAVAHWPLFWLGLSLVYGVLNMYLTVLVSEIVLRGLPEGTLVEQGAGA